MIIIDLDHYKKGLPIKVVSASNYRMDGIRNEEGVLTHNQVLVVNNVFSGGQIERGSIIRNAKDPNQVAIPNGSYDILDNTADTHHSGWFRLDRQDEKKYNDRDDDSGRNGFRFHLGVLSWGCVTVDNTQDNAKASWAIISTTLHSTSTTSVPEKRGRQWLNPFSELTKFGTMIIKGNDTIPIKYEE